MLIKKMVQKTLVALCVVGLAACSTTPDAPAVDEQPTATNDPVVETVTPPVISEEQRMRMESEEKRSARTIYFEFDESTVQQQYLEVIELHAKFLMKNGQTVTLEGHADERGTQAYNLALGEHRANSVAQYMINYGLSSSQIEVVTYGEERPADEGHTDGSWAKNRRVEITYR